MGSLAKYFITTYKQYEGLPRSVYVLFIATVINKFGGFVHMFLALLLSDKLGLTKGETGSYFLLLGASGMIGPMIGGWLADHIGRKKVYITVQALAAAMLIPCGLLGARIEIVYFLIAFNFFGSMVRPINSAIMTDITPIERRKDAFSLQYLGINFGVAVGPLVAGLLFNDHLEWIFWLDALTTFIAVALIALYIPETKPTKEELAKAKNLDSHERAEEMTFMQAFLRRPALVAFTFISFLSCFVYSQHSFAIPMHISDILGVEDPANIFGKLMSFNAIIVLILTGFVMSLTRKIKPIYNMMLAYMFYILGFGMLAYVDKYYLYFVSFFIWTIGEILATTNSGVYIANHTPMNHRGRFNAIINIIVGSGFTFGPFIAGLVLMEVNFQVFWLLIGGISALAAILAFMLGLAEDKKSKVKFVVEE